MRRSTILLALTTFAFGVIAACSGKTNDGGGTADSGIGGGDGGGLSSSCPSTAPAQGSACSAKGVECEYGGDVSLDCDTIARCDANGWTVTPPRSGKCPTPPNGGACPATYAQVPMGATCTTAASCAYAEGACACEVYCGPQYPVGHACEAGTPMSWQCTGAGSSCPAARPLVGSACAQEGQYCAYGDCNAIAEKCTSGTWHTQITGCPVSTSRAKDGVRYLSDDDKREVADRAMATRLATYTYKIGAPGARLGFVIEDDPTSPAVVRGEDRVDLYGYVSMTLAAVQTQKSEIEALRREVAELRAGCKRR
jgi:hypothetical protein